MQSLLKDSLFVFLRLVATLLDFAAGLLGLLALTLLLGLLGLGSATPVLGWVLLALGWCLLEAKHGRSPGKLVLGLRLELDGEYRSRVLRLLWRNLIKYGLIWLSIWFAGDIGQALIHSYGRPGLANSFFLLPAFWLPLLGLLTLLLSLRLTKSSRLPHDLLSGSRVESDSAPGVMAQSMFVALGLMLLLGGLSYALLSAFWVESPKASVSSVKANMHTFQTLVETYAVDWNGAYPASLEALRSEATLPGREYWKDITNPYSGRVGLDGSYGAMRASTGPADAGKVLYDPVRAGKGRIMSYYVYGLDKNGKRIQDKGHDFVLSNS